ncbi:hypothetical protein F5Y08DRAFT_240406 [Xylaria arbuscula]|nr:hypothetical protein F5Y08DRAFT_240406 [Xylaria arbuscula]
MYLSMPKADISNRPDPPTSSLKASASPTLTRRLNYLPPRPSHPTHFVHHILTPTRSLARLPAARLSTPLVDTACLLLAPRVTLNSCGSDSSSLQPLVTTPLPSDYTIVAATLEIMASSRLAGGAKHRLMMEMQDLSKEKWVNIDLVNDNILRWRLGLIVVNPDSAFNGGYFKVRGASACMAWMGN